MWTADPRRRRLRQSGGYTLVEATIVVFTTVTIAIVLNMSLGATHQADRFLSALRLGAERSQKIALEIGSLVNTSRKLFQGDDSGKAYLAALDLGPLVKAPGARLPVVAEDEVLDEDQVATPMTGNMLLFVRESDPVPCVANATLGILRHIDSYRFVCIYPRVTTESIAANGGPARDLVVWRSVVYPSWAQINEITDATQRKNVLRDLHQRYGFRHAWDPTAEVTAAFYAFDKDGNIDATPRPTFTIAEDPEVSDRGRLVYARVQLAATDPDDFNARAVLSADDPAQWKPDGFEVKVTGASQSRKIWLRLVLEVPESGGSRTAIVPATVISTCQDM